MMLSEKLVTKISHARREDRRHLFFSAMRPQLNWRILDIGCGEKFRSPWLMEFPKVVGLDIREIREHCYSSFVRADAARLPFADGAFDLVFSNSLIEHLPTLDHQRQFADEVRRVSRHYWVQTPNFNFPVDPHYMIPFFQHLPRRLQKPIAYKLSGSWILLGYYITCGWNIQGEYEFHTVYGLTPRSLQGLFPDAQIIKQRFLSMPQSIVAARCPEGPLL